MPFAPFKVPCLQFEDSSYGVFGGADPPATQGVTGAPVGSYYFGGNGQVYRKTGAGDLSADWADPVAVGEAAITSALNRAAASRNEVDLHADNTTLKAYLSLSRGSSSVPIILSRISVSCIFALDENASDVVLQVGFGYGSPTGTLVSDAVFEPTNAGGTGPGGTDHRFSAAFSNVVASSSAFLDLAVELRYRPNRAGDTASMYRADIFIQDWIPL